MESMGSMGLSENLALGTGGVDMRVTAGQAQYAPDNYDGHFVTALNPQARQSAAAFLLDFLGGQTPVIRR